MKHVLLMLLAGLFVLPSCSQNRKSPHETVEGPDVKVTYGRPYKKGREIFGGLEKLGKVWRTGADEATEITFAKDMNFGGKPVKAGTYTLFTIPERDEWTIILNSQLSQWGAYDYEKYKNKDVLHVKVPVKKLTSPVEQLTIRFEGTDMIIEWDTTQVAIPVTPTGAS
ncbi:MAG TPA: DUF2911 domain-containing protein [Chitinophagaceae bacterium]|nr:DUF2911 domain-containing protein [Chitinophagaceae bacterium]